jgi:hypothetical protein
VLNVAEFPVGLAYVPRTAPEKEYSAHAEDAKPNEEVTLKAIN